jgi:hypothetical protein
MAARDAESATALLGSERSKRRKNGTAALTQLFAPLHDLSWDEELDRLNHDESFTDEQMQMNCLTEQPNGTSTPVDCPKSTATIGAMDEYFFQPTVVSFSKNRG